MGCKMMRKVFYMKVSRLKEIEDSTVFSVESAVLPSFFFVKFTF
jgi:hypothetical protein